VIRHMVCQAQQCSHCRKVRHYLPDSGWSSWMNVLPRSLRCEYYQIEICGNPACLKKQEALVANCR
jgi:hypothetical protein